MYYIYRCSVNVFLGLGLPWVIRVIYHMINGGSYVVNTDGLQSAVSLFASLGALCITSLVLRFVYVFLLFKVNKIQ